MYLHKIEFVKNKKRGGGVCFIVKKCYNVEIVKNYTYSKEIQSQMFNVLITP